VLSTVHVKAKTLPLSLLQVQKFYTAPTLIRALMREGDEHVKESDTSSLQVLGTVGEPINPEAWKWYHRVGAHLHNMYKLPPPPKKGGGDKMADSTFLYPDCCNSGDVLSLWSCGC